MCVLDLRFLRAGISCGVVLGHNGERQVIVAGGYRYHSDMAQYIMRSTVDVFSLDMQHWRVGRDMPDARTTQVGAKTKMTMPH